MTDYEVSGVDVSIAWHDYSSPWSSLVWLTSNECPRAARTAFSSLNDLVCL